MPAVSSDLLCSSFFHALLQELGQGNLRIRMSVARAASILRPVANDGRFAPGSAPLSQSPSKSVDVIDDTTSITRDEESQGGKAEMPRAKKVISLDDQTSRLSRSKLAIMYDATLRWTLQAIVLRCTSLPVLLDIWFCPSPFSSVWQIPLPSPPQNQSLAGR